MNWGSAVTDSALWLAEAYAITVAVLVVTALLLARYTRWGNQFRRMAWPYFDPRRTVIPLSILALLLLLTIFGVRVTVLFSYWYKDFYDAIQNLDETAFWHYLRVFAILAAVHVASSLVVYLVGQTLDINWRSWLNDTLTDDWLDGRAYYRGNFLENPVDNPDQRIQADITAFATSSRTLSMGAVAAMVSIVSFTKILWDLSGPLTVFGAEIPRAMIFLVYIYVLVTTALAFWIGRPLIMLNFLNEKLGATFRYALIRLREYGESIAFYRGENVERRTLGLRFAAVIRNMWAIVFRTLKFSGFNLAVDQTAVVFPFLVPGISIVQRADHFRRRDANCSSIRPGAQFVVVLSRVLCRFCKFPGHTDPFDRARRCQSSCPRTSRARRVLRWQSFGCSGTRRAHAGW